MRKAAWIVGTALGIVVILLLGFSIFVKSYLSGERLKALVIPRLEALTGRTVTIDKIDIAVFKGVVIKGLDIKERGSNQDFVRMQEFTLYYSLLPLLRKQLVINKLEITSPYIAIKREKSGAYNFTDIPGRSAEAAKGKKPEEKGGVPFTLAADRIHISDGTIKFTDDQKKIPDVTADISDMVLKASIAGGLAVTGHADLRSLTAAPGGVRTNTSGKIEVAESTIKVALNTVVGKDSVSTTGIIRNYQEAPDIRLNFSSKQLDLDRLIPQERARPVALQESGKGGIPGLPAEIRGYRIYRVAQTKKTALRASGQVSIGTAYYGGYTIKDFMMGYRYKDDVMVLAPVQMNLAGGDKVNAAGVAKGNMNFRYAPGSADAVRAIKSTLTGKGMVDLNKVEVKSSNITRTLALFTGIDDLRSPNFDRAHFDFTIRGMKIYLQGTMNSRQLRLNPAGDVGFDKRLNILTDMSLSPLLAAKLSGNAKFAGFLKSKEGWSVIPLKIGGTLDKPAVGLNTAGLGKQFQKGLQGEIEKRLFKGLAPQKEESGKQQQGKGPGDLLRGIFGK